MPYMDKRGRLCGFLNIEEKENSGRFSRRYFILNTKEGKFQYFMDNPLNLPHNNRTPVDGIPLQFISKVSDARKQHPKVDSCFVVNFAGKTMFLQADDSKDMRMWIEALNDASRITVPTSMESTKERVNEWHQDGVSDRGYKTEIAGGVVCKIPIQTSDDDVTESSEGEFDSHGEPAYRLPAIKTGFAVKQGGMRKNWKRRYFVLTEQNILYFSSKKAKEPLGLIPRTDVQEVKISTKHPNRDNLYEIVTHKRTFYIQCDNPEEMVSWIEVIQKTYELEPEKSVQSSGDQLMKDPATEAFDMENFPVTKVYPHGEWCASDDAAKTDKDTTRQKKKSWLLW
ncbi:pleckstrin homology domain-containing family A member 1-like [Mizuhopecten yessoensis]|uniref:pleckstrin homology domain-containing family A member 1-like n=1 Tax=Mizuhopecten yessoensis TaxID=6573 RepID=UPI000B45BD74|nr:pleckstrin homology domain-containing family A member 1-like [Mizuhopecten yessoensis]XP_021374847.1 pleckstrin homology domain-containing family A member 1-like [Mizuhopecten yessoensis]XP_021374848.1 pleckstrin homology domain-containing family A member 1-like [Mizuhopecten yessoensis]XP_021374849.1 pleckstrin homology domain-containing family A member 1-like [Mizuhopecten yessoensis]